MKQMLESLVGLTKGDPEKDLEMHKSCLQLALDELEIANNLIAELKFDSTRMARRMAFIHKHEGEGEVFGCGICNFIEKYRGLPVIQNCEFKPLEEKK